MRRKCKIPAILAGLILAACAAAGPAAGAQEESMSQKSIYDFTVKTIDGQEKSLNDFRGKALLIVNTASKCGFTPQYKQLEELYLAYKDKGLEILAFPANNFMGQEPGTDAQIKEFCALKFKTTFPLFSKISVKGDDIHPFYRYLTSESGFNGPISWNFNKFLVGADGKVVARFGSPTSPQDRKLIEALEKILIQ